MIAILESLRLKSIRPVLTHYPPSYVPGEDEQRKSYISRLVFKCYDSDGIPAFSSRELISDHPHRTSFLAAGFIFSDGHFVKNVPNDPQIFFIGEEIAMAVRAFTHGYDLWTPHRVLLWHYYGRKDQPKVWSDHNAEAKESGSVELAWWERDKTSKQRVLSILGMSDEPCDSGEYRVGTQRTLQEYLWRSGLAFPEQKAHPDVFPPKSVSYFCDLPLSHTQWVNSLRFVNEKKILLAKEDIDFLQTGVLWWHVGVYNSHNTSVMVKKLSPVEIASFLRPVDERTTELLIDYNHIDE